MQVIAFISGKGGVGKTTLAVNVATALAQRGKRVVVIDLDPQNAVRLHLGMEPNDPSGFSREGISPESLFNSAFGVKFIPFGTISEKELEEFEAVLKAQADWIAYGINTLDISSIDFVILDTPPGPTVYLQQAMLAAHRALVVVLADAGSFTTVPGIISLVGQYTAGRSDFLGMSLLLNQMPHRSRLGHQVRTAMLESYGNLIVPIAIHRDNAVSEALAYARPVLHYEPGCEASLDVQHVADWLLDSIES